jgi:hypothetical protein
MQTTDYEKLRQRFAGGKQVPTARAEEADSNG